MQHAPKRVPSCESHFLHNPAPLQVVQHSFGLSPQPSHLGVTETAVEAVQVADLQKAAEELVFTCTSQIVIVDFVPVLLIFTFCPAAVHETLIA